MNITLQFLILSFLLFFLKSNQSAAQAPGWIWAQSAGATSNDYGYSIAIDDSENVYATGAFWGTVDFDPGPGIFNLTSAGDRDIFITKSDSSGNFIWAIAVGGPEDDLSFSIAAEHGFNGSVCISGLFEATTDFDPGPGLSAHTSNGASDIFIAKFDLSGNLIWVKTMGGIYDDRSNAIAIDPTGSVYSTGWFGDTVDFNPGVGVYNLITPLYLQIYICKLDSAGNFIWANTLGGGKYIAGTTIELDASGYVYTAGDFCGTVDFDPGPGLYNLSNAWAGPFILKTDSLGNFIWAGAFSGMDNAECHSIAVDLSGNVYTTGWFKWDCDFDPGPGTFLLHAQGLTDMFISKLDSSGNFVWAGAMGPNGISNSLEIDTLGYIYATGVFTGTDFDPGPGIHTLSNFSGVFVLKLDSFGNFVWVISTNDTSYAAGNDLALGNSGSIYVTGSYGEPAFTIGPVILTNAGPLDTNDIFIARLDLDLDDTGIDIPEIKSNIFLFPNPASEYFTIVQKNTGKIDILINELTGKIIYSQTFSGSNEININTASFSKGLYFLKIQTPQFTETKKLIISR